MQPRVALGLGIFVKVFDTSVYELSLLEEKLGRRDFHLSFLPKSFTKSTGFSRCSNWRHVV